MNICVVLGTIVGKIRYEFIVRSKNTAIAQFEILLENNSILQITGYNEIADYCYQKFEKGKKILVYGYLNNQQGIVIEDIAGF